MATARPPRCFSEVIKIKLDAVDEYFRTYNLISTSDAKCIWNGDFIDYSIFYDDDSRLFATFKYVGQDFDADRRKTQSVDAPRQW